MSQWNEMEIKGRQSDGMECIAMQWNVMEARMQCNRVEWNGLECNGVESRWKLECNGLQGNAAGLQWIARQCCKNNALKKNEAKRMQRNIVNE
eukprot:scaffold417113_cov33-Prasinocladus_malaysianus.AAC.1